MSIARLDEPWTCPQHPDFTTDWPPSIGRHKQSAHGKAAPGRGGGGVMKAGKKPPSWCTKKHPHVGAHRKRRIERGQRRPPKAAVARRQGPVTIVDAPAPTEPVQQPAGEERLREIIREELAAALGLRERQELRAQGISLLEGPLKFSVHDHGTSTQVVQARVGDQDVATLLRAKHQDGDRVRIYLAPDHVDLDVQEGGTD